MPRTLTQDEVSSFRESLVAAAERRFADHGYAGVTLRALASDLGCSAMTPYRYFENKEAIFAAVRTAAFMRLAEVVDRTALEHPDPIERIRAFGRTYLRFATEEPAAYRIMFELTQSTELEPDEDGQVRRGWEPLVEAIQEAVSAGKLFGDPLDLAHVAWMGLHGLVTLRLADKLMLGRSFEELVEPVIDVFLRGAGAPPAASLGATP